MRRLDTVGARHEAHGRHGRSPATPLPNHVLVLAQQAARRGEPVAPAGALNPRLLLRRYPNEFPGNEAR
jgi:hypothetical protein